MIKGIVVPVEGKSQEIEINGLSDMQKVVGGLVEPVELKDGSSMYVNEEGLILNLPVNTFASDVAGLGGHVHALMFGIRGDALILGPVDKQGNDTDATPLAKSWVQRVEVERFVGKEEV